LALRSEHASASPASRVGAALSDWFAALYEDLFQRLLAVAPGQLSRLGTERLSSKPPQTPQTTVGVKPTNQASVQSLVVPVLPAAGWLKPQALAAQPVPLFITLSSMLVTTYAVAGRMAS